MDDFGFRARFAARSEDARVRARLTGVALLARDIRYDALIQAYDAVWAALCGLPDRDREVLVLRYGLDGERAYTQREIATRWGMTHARVEQIEDRAMRRLRAALLVPES